MSIESLESEILYKETEIAELKQQIEALKSLTPEQQLAIFIHDQMCRHNHIDGCSWYYEIERDIHSWDESEHQKYLHKADDLLYEVDLDIAKKFITVLMK